MVVAFFELSTNIDINVEFPDRLDTARAIGKAISDSTGIPVANVLVLAKGDEPIVCNNDLKDRLAYAEFSSDHNLTSDVKAKVRKEVAKILKSKWGVRGSHFMLEFLDDTDTDFSLLYPTDEEDEKKDGDKDASSTS